jgi:hypothetical protein
MSPRDWVQREIRDDDLSIILRTTAQDQWLAQAYGHPETRVIAPTASAALVEFAAQFVENVDA